MAVRSVSGLDGKALDGRIECSWNEKDLRIEKKCGFNKQFYFFEPFDRYLLVELQGPFVNIQVVYFEMGICASCPAVMI